MRNFFKSTKNKQRLPFLTREFLFINFQIGGTPAGSEHSMLVEQLPSNILYSSPDLKSNRYSIFALPKKTLL